MAQETINLPVIKFPKISQSLIKAFWDYTDHNNPNSLCGLLFQAKYIDKNPLTETQPSEAMNAGCYFEYLCTGSLPKSGLVPIPAYTAKGALTAPYQKAKESAELFKKLMEQLGITILKTGYYLTDGVYDGVIDIKALWHGEEVFIDLKYSGLLDDKWNDMGWELNSLPTKDKLMVQGVHYKMLAQRVLGIENIPFYYFLFNSTDPKDVRIIKQVSDEVRIASHVVHAQMVAENVMHGIKNGFMAKPTYKKCNDCPINTNCGSRAIVPEINEVTY